MDFQSKINGLYREAMQGINYSYLPRALKIIMTIILSPVILSAYILYATFGVLNFFCKLAIAPCEYLEMWVEKKKEKVHWLTEAVILVITLPFIFFLRVLISIYSVIFEIVWFFLLIATYTATLGGVRWQPYVIEAKYDEIYTWNLKKSESFVKIYSIIPIVFTGLTVIFYIVSLICYANYKDSLDYTSYSTEREVYEIMSAIHDIFAYITAFLVFIINPIVFAKKDIKPLNAIKCAAETLSDENN